MQIIVNTDNEPIVNIWNSSKDEAIMTLVRELFFISTKHIISVTFIHIPGKQNIHADLLSRLQVESFRSICPDCFPLPSTIPQQILDVLDRIQQTIYASLSLSLQLQLSGLKAYSKFCHHINMIPFPLTEEKLCFFATHSTNRGLTEKSIRAYLH